MFYLLWNAHNSMSFNACKYLSNCTLHLGDSSWLWPAPSDGVVSKLKNLDAIIFNSAANQIHTCKKSHRLEPISISVCFLYCFFNCCCSSADAVVSVAAKNDCTTPCLSDCGQGWWPREWARDSNSITKQEVLWLTVINLWLGKPKW